jgi:ABC-type multidrug transport system ATPase subunit
MGAVIETRGLRKRYRRVDALRGLDLEVPEGSICGFLGPNGAGKTTTMRILMGLIRPSDGWASVMGADIDGNGLSVRSRIGYLPQDPSFFPRATVRNTLRFVARRYLSGSKPEIDHKVDETLGLVGLDDRADRKVKALSGGELRRLGIGQAVIGDPDLLILDEPSVGLDPEGRRQVLDLLDGLKERMTIFYSSHILDDVERIADHVVIVNDGTVVEQGEDVVTSFGVEPHRRLVEDQQVRVADDGLTDAETAPLAPGEGVDLAAGAPGEADKIEGVVDPGVDRGPRARDVATGDEAQCGADRGLGEERRVLWEVADAGAPSETVAVDVITKHGSPPLRGTDQAHEDLHRGGLAGTVGSEEAADRTFRDLEVEAAQRLDAAVPLT